VVVAWINLKTLTFKVRLSTRILAWPGKWERARLSVSPAVLAQYEENTKIGIYQLS